MRTPKAARQHGRIGNTRLRGFATKHEIRPISGEKIGQAVCRGRASLDGSVRPSLKPQPNKQVRRPRDNLARDIGLAGTAANGLTPATKAVLALTLRHDLLCRPPALQSAAHRAAAAAAAPLPRPTARASTHRALHRLSGSPAWPWDVSVRQSRSASWSGNHRDQVRAGDRFGFGAPLAPEFGPDTREGEEQPVVIQREPDDILFAGRRIGPLQLPFGDTQAMEQLPPPKIDRRI
jgi:hypothetical protein